MVYKSIKYQSITFHAPSPIRRVCDFTKTIDSSGRNDCAERKHLLHFKLITQLLVEVGH